jgi:hypothetical protein
LRREIGRHQAGYSDHRRAKGQDNPWVNMAQQRGNEWRDQELRESDPDQHLSYLQAAEILHRRQIIGDEIGG